MNTRDVWHSPFDASRSRLSRLSSATSGSMDAHNQPAEKLRPPTLSLITPSASPPPPPRSHSRATNYPPDSDREQPSPSKRARLTRTPSSPLHHASSPFNAEPSSSTSHSASASASRNEPDEISKIDFQKARHESTMRVLNVWNQLAERYARPLDEDDIIDFATGKVIKDRGVLRSINSDYSFGFLSKAAQADDASSDGGGAVTEGEGEGPDEIDEVEAEIQRSKDFLEKERKALLKKKRALGPEDQDDLKEFLRLERERQEMGLDEEFSDEEWETEADVGSKVVRARQVIPDGERSEGAFGFDRGKPDGAYISHSRLDKGKFKALAQEEEEEESDASRSDGSVRRILHEDNNDEGDEDDEDSSEDELGTWDFDEHNAVYRIAKPSSPEAEPDPDLDPDPSPSHSRSPSPSSAPPSPPPPPPFLSSQPPDDEVIEIFDSPTPSPPPTTRYSPTPQHPPSPSPAPIQIQFAVPSIPARFSAREIPSQLQTPPQSSSSVVSRTPSVYSPTPDPNPTPKARPKPRPAYKLANATPAAPAASSSSSKGSGASKPIPSIDLNALPASSSSSASYPKNHQPANRPHSTVSRTPAPTPAPKRNLAEVVIMRASSRATATPGPQARHATPSGSSHATPSGSSSGTSRITVSTASGQDGGFRDKGKGKEKEKEKNASSDAPAPARPRGRPPKSKKPPHPSASTSTPAIPVSDKGKGKAQANATPRQRSPSTRPAQSQSHSLLLLLGSDNEDEDEDRVNDGQGSSSDGPPLASFVSGSPSRKGSPVRDASSKPAPLSKISLSAAAGRKRKRVSSASMPGPSESPDDGVAVDKPDGRGRSQVPDKGKGKGKDASASKSTARSRSRAKSVRPRSPSSSRSPPRPPDRRTAQPPLQAHDDENHDYDHDYDNYDIPHQIRSHPYPYPHPQEQASNHHQQHAQPPLHVDGPATPNANPNMIPMGNQPIDISQAQYFLAQAMQSLSYIIQNGGGGPGGPGGIDHQQERWGSVPPLPFPNGLGQGPGQFTPTAWPAYQQGQGQGQPQTPVNPTVQYPHQQMHSATSQRGRSYGSGSSITDTPASALSSTSTSSIASASSSTTTRATSTYRTPRNPGHNHGLTSSASREHGHRWPESVHASSSQATLPPSSPEPELDEDMMDSSPMPSSSPVSRVQTGGKKQRGREDGKGKGKGKEEDKSKGRSKSRARKVSFEDHSTDASAGVARGRSVSRAPGKKGVASASSADGSRPLERARERLSSGNFRNEETNISRKGG